MRMILVHGISQEGKSSEAILKEWLDTLNKTYESHGPNPLAGLSRIEAAFYGDELFKRSSVKFKDEAIALGAEEAEDDFAEFAHKALEEMALKLDVKKADIEAEEGSTSVHMGAGAHKKSVKAIARLIERISPWKGVLAMRLLGQAHAYIRNKNNHDAVNDLVRPLFEDDEEIIIVSHSLGTIVSFSLLREYAENGRPRNCPLFITLGSPLGIHKIREGFRKPRTRPKNVTRWVNGADPSDFVALHPKLDKESFGAEVTNYSDIKNAYENPHAISGYLSEPRIAQEIRQAIANRKKRPGEV